MSTIRVLIVDDHDLFREGVRAVLQRAEGIEICSEASSAEEALAHVAEANPDVVVTDITMKGMNGLQLAEILHRDHPEIRTLILSIHNSREYAVHAVRSGAAGYLFKDAASSELEEAIRAVSRGEVYLSPVISGYLMEDYNRLLAAAQPAADPLTNRQREVLKLIAEGFSTKAIARRLSISVKTAETHRSMLMERLEIHDVAGLVRYALRKGIVTLDA